MALNQRTAKFYKQLNMPLSYRINDYKDRILDCENVYCNNGRIDTRNGFSRYNALPVGTTTNPILSLSYFKNTSDTRYIFAKITSAIYAISTTSTHTAVKTGLSATTKHRGITLNNRHIFACESDGLFQYNTTYGFTQLGQAAPAAPTVALGTGVGALSDDTWYVKISFYSSTTGFESNASPASAGTTTSTPNSRVVVTTPTTAANASIDKVYIYASSDAVDYYFAGEVALATGTYNLDADPTSTQVPQTTSAPPISGGGKYLAEFNGRLVYAGNSTYPNDVYFSNPDDPDSFDDTSTQLALFISGNGPITGIATGFFNDSNLEPYLVIFKKNRIAIYSELGDVSRIAYISDQIGCVSNETIITRNGDVYFLSERGWFGIFNGILLKDNSGNVVTLGLGDIDDIFTNIDYGNEITQSLLGNYHSVYYSRLDQYVTWTARGGDTTIDRAYLYEYSTSRGFKVYTFPFSCGCSCIAEDASGREIVLFGGQQNFIYKHSVYENYSDVAENNAATAISAYFVLSWIDGEDMATTYNFRDVIVRGIGDSADVELRGYVNFDKNSYSSKTLTFMPSSGFELDVDRLDVDSLGDMMEADTRHADINKTGESFALGFFKDDLNQKMSIIKVQIDFNKNGNLN